MDKLDIKFQIEILERAIKEASDPSSFVANDKIIECKKKIQELRELCPHDEVENGVCKICGIVTTEK